jgi:outer membrane protein OmpA-like peptidoglycan-associated protein
MCKRLVNLLPRREDDLERLAALLVGFAEKYQAGEANPHEGAHFVVLPADLAAAFLHGVNERLRAIGADQVAVVVGATGYSVGEVAFYAPPEWAQDPQLARGGVVAGRLRESGWNLAQRWLTDNGIPNNPDPSRWDPEALNWVEATDAADAARQQARGACVDVKQVKTGAPEKKCVQAFVGGATGAPAGLVRLTSTQDYRAQMPYVIVGNKKWMGKNKVLVRSLLAAAFAGAARVDAEAPAREQAAAIAALLFEDKGAVPASGAPLLADPADLPETLTLFNLLPGTVNVFAATYSAFADQLVAQYPQFLPGYPSLDEILDLGYLRDVATDTPPAGPPPGLKFPRGGELAQPIARRAWDIQFQPGSAKFTAQTLMTLEALLRDLVIAGGTAVEIHGHADDAPSPEKNMQLSRERAEAVKIWLETMSSSSFPPGRLRTVAHGAEQPVAADAGARPTKASIEIVLGRAQ